MAEIVPYSSSLLLTMIMLAASRVRRALASNSPLSSRTQRRRDDL
jgi:hypothetical protein